MCYYNAEYFSNLMELRFNIEVEEEQVKEESVLLYKEGLDKKLVSNSLLSIAPDMVLLYSCTYDTDEKEWIVCVAFDADTSYPLFLICLKDGKKVYEEDLRID